MHINKRNQSHKEIWQKLSFPNPNDKNLNQEHKTLQNIIQGSKKKWKEFIITLEMLMEWKTIQIGWVLM